MEVASLALSIAALFTYCCEGYKLLCSAKSTTTAISLTRCKFEIQQARLLTWGRGWGLLEDGGSATTTVALEKTLSAEGMAITRLLESILSEIAAVLSDGDRLKAHYGLEGFGGEDTQERQPYRQPVLKSSPLSILKRSRTNVADQQQSMAILKRLSWSVKDKDRFAVLVSDLRELNDGLCSLLPVQSRSVFSHALNAEVLSGKSDSAELEVVGEAAGSEYPSLANAARLRATGVGIDQSPQTSAMPLQTKLSRNTITFPEAKMAPNEDLQAGGTKSVAQTRMFATYQEKRHGFASSNISSTVLVEWKPYDFQATGTKAFALALRADGLARLLQNSAGQPGLQTLPLIGYIDDLEDARFGFVFRCPAPRLFGFPSEARSLNWILSSNLKLPALEVRFHLARTLARTLFMFHCAHWLHKDFSSHNVAFASKTETAHDNEEADLTSPETAHDNEEADLTSPFVLGFTYSRPEDHEGISSELRDDGSEEAGLYQHPQLTAFHKCHAAPRYSRLFDIYALGCVLLEIGLWRPLKDLWKPRYRNDPKKWRSRLVDTWVTELRGRCGGTYEEVVRSCFILDEMADSNEAESLSRFCWDVLGKLEGLKV